MPKPTGPTPQSPPLRPPNESAPGHLNRWLGRATAWLNPLHTHWPRQCELCGTWGQAALCADCVATYAPPCPRCPHCALASPGGRECGACLREPPTFDAAMAAVDYAFPWDGLITRFKFQQQPELARSLSGLLPAAAPSAHLIVPMPLSEARLRQRGYNQAWELTQHLARRWQLPARADVLQRWRDTPHQTRLSKAERARNLREALWVDAALTPYLSGQHVVLVDDVLTTGASANAAAHALKQAGAAQVLVCVLARTP